MHRYRCLKRMGWVSLAFAGAISAGNNWAGEITLYEDQDFRGRRVTLRDEVSDFKSLDFNDRARSVVVRAGTWQVCTNAGFSGRCVTLEPGSYRDLSRDLEDRMSSAREVGDGRRPGPGARPGPERGARIVLFEEEGFRGRSVALDYDVFDFARIGFNDRARSAIVYGGQWELCDDAGFRGGCATLSRGRYDNIGQVEGRVSSARLVGGYGGGGLGGGGVYEGAGNRRAGNQPYYDVRATLYEGPNFSGRSIGLTGDASNLARIDFNDRVRSMRIDGGDWALCTDDDFRGDCRVFGPGSYGDLPGNLSGRVSSARVVPRGGGGYEPRR